MARALIGQKIRERRRALGITQVALASRLAISASYLNLIEGNRRNIGGALLQRVAAELQLPVDEFDGAAERRLIDDVGEIAADARLGALALDPSRAADFVAQHPQWARALVTLHRACVDAGETVTALSDRLSHDPFLGDAVHSLLGSLSNIRSVAEILDSVHELDDARRQRFVSMIAGDSRRVSDVAQALAAFFGKASTAARSITPIEEVDDFIAEHDNHFAALEAAADALRDETGAHGEGIDAALAQWLQRHHGTEPPPGRRFDLARQVAARAFGETIAALVQSSAALGSPAARRRAELALQSYAAAALLMPYAAFRDAAAGERCDVDALGRRFGTSFEQVCHRLTTLRRAGAEGIRFGFMRADPAGYMTKRFPLPRLPMPRYGNACPLWAVYEAFQSPGATVRQLAEFPGGERYLFVARAVEKPRPSFRMPRRFVSVMLACDAAQAGDTVYGDGLDLSPRAPATTVGPSCRICPRRDCVYREDDPIIDAGRRWSA